MTVLRAGFEGPPVKRPDRTCGTVSWVQAPVPPIAALIVPLIVWNVESPPFSPSRDHPARDAGWAVATARAGSLLSKRCLQ